MPQTIQSKFGTPGPSRKEKTKSAQPQIAIIYTALARQHFEAEKRELKIKLDSVVKYFKAWEESRKSLGPAGEPSLRHTTEMEMLRFERQFESVVKPAMYEYADAVQQGVQYGCYSHPDLSESQEKLAHLLILDALGPHGHDDMLISHSEWDDFIEPLAQYAQQCWIGQPDPLCFKLVTMCLQLAEICGVQHCPAIQDLKSRIDKMSSNGCDIHY